MNGSTLPFEDKIRISIACLGRERLMADLLVGTRFLSEFKKKTIELNTKKELIA